MEAPKILLVEDDFNLREVFGLALRDAGYQISLAGDGEEGLKVASEQKPDLIIADLMMPKLSGFEMIEILQTAPELKDVPVIIMTALDSERDKKRGSSLNIKEYLVKSQVTLQDFVATINKYLPVVPADSKVEGTIKTMDEARRDHNPAEEEVFAQASQQEADAVGALPAQKAAEQIDKQVQDAMNRPVDKPAQIPARENPSDKEITTQPQPQRPDPESSSAENPFNVI